jgi:glyoxylase-like metal-dependent hydrolase (beta-lactamase superfamily II)
VFPNARFILSEIEWNFWTGRRTDLRAMDVSDHTRETIAISARRCLAGLRFQVELIASETEVVPGVWAIPAPGHTPGHVALLLDGGADRLLDLGDAALHPIHLEEPDWNNALDLAADVAAVTRRALLERAVAENMRVMGFHFPFPSVGRVAARASRGWDWSPGW